MDWYPALSHLVRICEHGLRHPDPDDLNMKVVTLQLGIVEAISSVHLDKCDGCSAQSVSNMRARRKDIK